MLKMKDEVIKFRQLLCDVIRTQCTNNEAAVLLSGGVDSQTVIFACLELGIVPTAYTFRLKDYESRDSFYAKSLCEKFGITHKMIVVDSSTLELDFLTLANKYECRKKTQYECIYPFIHLFPHIKEQGVITGWGAYFGISRKASTSGATTNKAVFDKMRLDEFNHPNPDGRVQLRQLIKEYNKILIAPYFEQSVFDFLFQFNWGQLNKPIQKAMSVYAFNEYFSKIKVRQASNLQLDGGIDVLFESLLKSSLNKKKRLRVMDLCRDYAKNN